MYTKFEYKVESMTLVRVMDSQVGNLEKFKKRVLWAVNHKTLMKSEVSILRSLGYEVFVPKILPKSGFRSGDTSYEFDSDLSLPPEVLNELNKHNFFEGDWSPILARIINEYFDIIFVIHWPVLISEAASKFQGKILFRVYGLQNDFSYSQFVLDNGGQWLKQIFDLRQNDLILALGYSQITENEPDWLARNSIYLPITMPEEFWNFANTHNGKSNKALFLCSNRNSSEYYGRQHESFKKAIGSNPYLVVDSSDPSDGDPNVLFRPTDQELIRLFQECSLFYSPSEELRSTLYSPIEASIIGCPVIYHGDSLLGRLTPEVKFGKVNSWEEAKSIIHRIQNGDTDLSQLIIEDQKALAEKFKISNCIETWKTSFPEALNTTTLNSLTHSDFTRPVSAFPGENFHKHLDAEIVFQHQDAINLIKDRYEINFMDSQPTPWFIRRIKGISWPESFGRWTLESQLEIEFLVELPRKFNLRILTSSIGKNLGKKVKISAGSKSSTFRIKSLDLIEYSINCESAENCKTLKLQIPKPTKPINDSRNLGLAIRSITISNISLD